MFFLLLNFGALRPRAIFHEQLNVVKKSSGSIFCHFSRRTQKLSGKSGKLSGEKRQKSKFRRTMQKLSGNPDRFPKVLKNPSADNI